MAPMMHPRYQPFKWEGVYAGINMSDTGGLIVYTINGWQITTLKIKGGARAPWIRPWRSKDAGLMLAQRLRRWTNINQTFVQNIPTAVSVARFVVI